MRHEERFRSWAPGARSARLLTGERRGGGQGARHRGADREGREDRGHHEVRRDDHAGAGGGRAGEERGQGA